MCANIILSLGSTYKMTRINMPKDLGLKAPVNSREERDVI